MKHLSIFISCIGILAPVFAAPPQNAPTTAPVKYRIASFHQGRANKDLIRLSHRLGFNEVQFQIEGSTTKGLGEFTERDKKEGYIKLCHSLGMDVSVWIHELSDAPKEIGPITLDNDKLWKMLDDRYEHVLGELLPDVDCLVLTVVETQINMTDAPMMRKLVDVIYGKCKKYNKRLVVRTFVWYPEEFQAVMDCVKGLPEDVTIMTKVVPQDWQMRGMDDKGIGAVGEHQQIIEYDVAGEYFQISNVANCFPDVVLRQFNYGLSKGIEGICVRVDRWDQDILGYPQEVNLWALGFAATGRTTNLDEIWKAYTTERFGAQAAPYVTEILKPTGEVIAEATNVGPFTFGDTRGNPPTLERDPFKTNWVNWKWDPQKYMTRYERTKTGDPLISAREERANSAAIASAEKSLTQLEAIKSLLRPEDYGLLKAKLQANLDYMTVMSRVQLAYLRVLREYHSTDLAEKMRLREQLRVDLADIKNLQANPPAPVKVKVLGKTKDAKIRLIDLGKWLESFEKKLDAIEGLNR